MTDLSRTVAALADDAQARLVDYARHETPTGDAAALNALADVLEARHRELGARTERIACETGDHLVARLGDPAAPHVLLLGHHDTVWPVGSLLSHPWRVADGRAYGPGCFDMKAGLVQLFHALAGLSSLDGITVLVTGDEELGALTSRPLLHEEAARASAAFVLEASADGGALKTARKGVAWYEVAVTGR
ncbi:MAG: M20/M25/M40 family metallo-hydrolase, partial [Actinomycetes bacterium]